MNLDYDIPSYKPKDEIHSFVLSPRHSLWNSIFSRNRMDLKAISAVLQVQKQRRNGAMQEVQHGRRLWRGKLFITCIGTSYRLIRWPLPDVPWYFTSVQSSLQLSSSHSSFALLASLLYIWWHAFFFLLPRNISPEAEAQFSRMNCFILWQAFPFCFFLPDCLQLISLVNHASKSVSNKKKRLCPFNITQMSVLCRPNICLQESNSFINKKS